MRLGFLTQTLDPSHGALAQTVDLVRALSARVDELVVLARESRVDDLPANVDVRTFDAASKLGRGVAFERALVTAHVDAVLAHMVPTFAVLAAPIVRVRRGSLLLWYTHWNPSRSLKVATALVDRVLSVDAKSFPLATPKLRGIGHAIDVTTFDAPPPEPHDGRFRLLWLGRYAPWKGLPTLLDALERAPALDVTLELRGAELTDAERTHRRELERRVAAAPALADRVVFADAVARAEVPALLRAADAVVSPIEPRGATLDKVVYEASACSRPVISTSVALAGFLDDLPLRTLVPPRDPDALASALTELVAAPPEVRAALGRELRRRVVEQHSLDAWADAVVATVRELQSPHGQTGDGRAGG
jgi:glycosyltransferase involved in cell wall biosynthesis